MRTKHDFMNRKCIPSLCRLVLASGNIATVQQRRTPVEKQAVRLMGKKSRLTGGAVGRRTILQLSPPGSRSGNVGERDEALSGSDDEQESDGHRFLKDKRTNMKASTVKATEGLSLLGAYEDSDEEDVGDSQRSTANPLNRSADIDSTLANFMAEIDAITTQPSTDGAGSSVAASTPPRPEVNTQQTAANEGQNQQVTEAQFEFNTQYSLAGVDVEMGDWQEVWDENSGCYYYWNTVSNEVSWELPHYLANQVQSLAKYANSTGVNGNGTAHAGQCTEESTQASAKETKIKKDVIESVVGLTSEEEERRGVAASLLGPLIPSEVKEAEEKWRKRLLKGLDEPENSLDSDGDGICPAGSPLAPVQEQDSVPVPQKDLVKKQSRENSDAEETEEDTMELELALERKKAELRALEEGDGSAGGSSPCSETSQEAAGSRGVLLKKNRWKTAFPSVASPDSNSRGSDQQESIEPVPPKALESVVEDEDKEPEDSEEKTGTKPPVKDEVETPELKFQIGELANTLTSKMEFLGINKKAISNFQLLLLQTETRIADWREGALNGVYLRRRLQEAAEHIKYYELNATPKGWSCHWDREHRRYFYVNDRSGASQWDFPTEDDKVEDAKGSHDTQTSNQVDNKPTSVPTGGLSGSSAYPAPPAPPLPTTTSFWPASQPPLPDSPPPPSHYPPPPPLPPGSPPPPPPLPDSDSEIMEVEMEMDDDDGEPPAPGTEEDGSSRPPLPPGTTSTKIGESSGPLGKGQKRKAGQMNKTITIGSSPILYTQPAASAAPVMPVAAYWAVPAVTAPIVPSEPPVPPVPALPPQPPLPLTQPPFDPPPPKPLPTDKTKKAKKDKQSKKIKTKMPSLVKKWQSIQKELDEEEKSSSSDEDRDQLNKKSIEEWKQQQLVTGKASKNANFEALPEDWRERLKKRKMNST